MAIFYVREKFFIKKELANKQRIINVATTLHDVKLIYPDKGAEADYPYLKPASNHEHTYLRPDGSLIYRVNYTMDGAGYRNPVDPKIKDKHVAIVGCSWTFGLGLPYTHTLGNELQQKLPDSTVYNLAMNGSGPQDHLYLFSKYSLKTYIKPSKGIMLYLYFSDQFDRATLSPTFLDWAEKGRPVYKLKGTDLEFAGKLKDTDEWKRYQNLKQLNLSHTYLEATGISKDVDPEKVRTFAFHIKKIQDLYLKDFPESRFFFIPLPYADPVTEETLAIISALKDLGVPIGPYQAFFKHFPGKDEDYLIKDDGHPNHHANNIFASVLKEWMSTI